MIKQVMLRAPHDPTVLDLTTHLITHYWMSRPRLTERRWLHLMDELIVGSFRAEGYVIEDGVLVSAYIANPAVDPHYGEIALPVVDWIRPTFREQPGVIKQHLQLRELCAVELGASGLLTVKHIDNKTQIQRVRYFK